MVIAALIPTSKAPRGTGCPAKPAKKAIAAEALYKEGKLSVSDIARNRGYPQGYTLQLPGAWRGKDWRV
jgi:hypothetical protein